jgi:predicted Ser/Thr protein kinase
MTTGSEYVRDADAALEEAYEEPMSIAEYVDRVFERPSIAAHASLYLLSAIEAAGTRPVVEEGEERERYRFFDDPENDGEHAILGNTEVLNRFVDDLRVIAAGRGKGEKIVWFDGPTATGKSELKRCLINGLREYSKTPEGRRYTVEWNIVTADSSPSLSYGDSPSVDESNWYESPVQSHPLSVFPEATRSRLLADLQDASDDGVPIRLPTDLDPFSREAYDYLEEFYRREGKRELFSAITDPRHLRVKNYVVDVGRGIGVLHSEDDGSPKERLVGSWMAGMLQKLDSRGRKNPQAFSYDGVLSQGNGLLTIVEDATQHADLLQKLLNVPDERQVKLDKGIGMDVDSQLLIISNPDLDDQLNQHADRNGTDPLKALKRRLDRHEFRYLTNLSLECELLHRELTGETSVWEVTEDERERLIRSPVVVEVSDGDGVVRERELAPHAIEAAAMYSVVSRLDDGDLPEGLSLIEKAIVFDRGYLTDGDERREKEELPFGDGAGDGVHGIPVTFTRDVIAELLGERPEREHPTLPVEDVVMPRDVLNAMVDGLAAAPVFSPAERSEFEDRLVPVKNYVFERQETDVIDAIMDEKRVDEETVSEYVEHVYAWTTDERIATDRGEVDADPLKMKVFEIEHLGRFDEDDFVGTEPTTPVARFRREKIVTALNRHAWTHRTEDFRIEDVNVLEIPVVRDVLESHDWDDVARVYDDLEPRLWDDPPANTETALIKARTIETMCELFDYSEASAELTSRHVMGQVSYRWD